MKANILSRLPRLLTGFGLAIVVHRAGLCEIGAVSGNPQATSPAVQLYQFEIIGDDPVPVGGLWHVFTTGVPSRIVLNPDGEANGDGTPTFLRNPAAGVLAVAWARNSAQGYDIVLSRFVGGAWTEPQVLVAGPGDELDPQLVLDPDGSAHLLYWVDGATPQVFYMHAPADLSSWSSPVLVSQPGQAACRPAGAVHAGVFRAAYEVHDFGYGNAPRQVVLSRYDNGAFTPEVVAMTNNLQPVRPQVHSNGNHMWIDWVDAQAGDGSGEVGWTRLDAQGHWEPIRFEGFVNREGRDYFARGTVRSLAIQ